jgi:hypothetical protein
MLLPSEEKRKLEIALCWRKSCSQVIRDLILQIY